VTDRRVRSPVSLARFPERHTQQAEHVPLCDGGERRAGVHLDAAAADHALIQRVLRQAHALGLGQGAQRAVEVRRAREVHGGARKLAVGHQDDVQSAVAVVDGPRQTAHAHVLLLLALLLVAHQVIGQKS